MIFVTVGTHEQPFDRLLKCIDNMVKDKKITEEVIIQKGFTDATTQMHNNIKTMTEVALAAQRVMSAFSAITNAYLEEFSMEIKKFLENIKYTGIGHFDVEYDIKKVASEKLKNDFEMDISSVA